MKPAWYDRAFGPWYLKLYPHRDAAEAQRALAAIRVWIAADEPVLDLACGPGRHLEILRREGLRAFGLDRSWALLAATRSRPETRGRTVRGDMRFLPFAPDTFGTVLLMFTSFGYFESREEHARLLVSLIRVTRSRGRLVLDYLNEPAVRAGLVPESSRTVSGHSVREQRRIEPRGDGIRVVKRIEIRDGGTVVDAFEEVVSLYTPAELAAMLTEAGWILKTRYGDYGGGPWTPGSPRLIAVAEKA